MLGELANCERCDAVFVKTTRSICRACYKEEETAFDIVYQFLKMQKNREAIRTEIADETGVSEELITKFIKERRLMPADFPNLSYPCEQCGASITKGCLCETCATDIKSQLAQHERIEQMERSRQDVKKEDHYAYYTLNKRKND